ncbi:MAG: hypothetical protein II038_17315, partial [Lachnospiraceae bacterium]|nr:hypothetical protein [Lachnospiraceae bacterium]
MTIEQRFQENAQPGVSPLWGFRGFPNKRARKNCPFPGRGKRQFWAFVYRNALLASMQILLGLPRLP